MCMYGASAFFRRMYNGNGNSGTATFLYNDFSLLGARNFCVPAPRRRVMTPRPRTGGGNCGVVGGSTRGVVEVGVGRCSTV